MKSIPSSKVIYRMNHSNKPALCCNSGDIVEFNTLDCFNNKLIPLGTSLEVDALPNSNPSTGPLYIEDAKPGDTLKVEILDIMVGSIGINLVGTSNKINEIEIRRVPVKNERAELTTSLSLPVEPMIGVIGVATYKESISTSLPGKHGGNMDCSQIKKGSILYLPIKVEGALLSIGDLHALMGDGEIGENGLEIEGKVIVKVDVIKNRKISGPVLYVDDKWATISSRKTVEEAANEATEMMRNLLIEYGGFDYSEASLIINVAGNIRLCQIYNIEKTVSMEISKDCFINSEVF